VAITGSNNVRITNFKVFSTALYGAVSVDGTSVLDCRQCDFGPFETGSGSNDTGLIIASGGVVKFSGGRLAGLESGPALSNAGTFYDLGKIDCVLSAGGATPCGSANWNGTVVNTGTIYGNASVTGVLQTAGNIALTSGWGASPSVAVDSPPGSSTNESFTITVGTSPGTSATATVTFPVPFWSTPKCLPPFQIGGTQTLTSMTLGTVTATTAQVVANGSLAGGNTLDIQLACTLP